MITSAAPPPASVSSPSSPLSWSVAGPPCRRSAPGPPSIVAGMATDTIAVSSRSPRSRRTDCTPPAGQNVWMIHEFASS